MRNVLAGAGLLIGLVLLAESARAQCTYPAPPPLPPTPPYPMGPCKYPVIGPFVPSAPDMNRPSFVGYDYCGNQYVGVYPPFAPWNGALPPPCNGAGGAGAGAGAGAGGPGVFATHPFARSPRDFFMYYEREQEYTPWTRYR